MNVAVTGSAAGQESPGDDNRSLAGVLLLEA